MTDQSESNIDNSKHIKLIIEDDIDKIHNDICLNPDPRIVLLK
jgi:hypothetical protein